MKQYNLLKNLFLALVLVCTAGSLHAQKIKFKINDQKDTTVFLIKYYGNKLLYADTAVIKSGLVEFDGKKQTPGVVGLLLPGQRFFELVYNNEEVFIETSAKGDFYEPMKVRKSEENTVFVEYVKFMHKQRTGANALSEKLKTVDAKSPMHAKIQAQLDSISDGVKAFQAKQASAHASKLVGKIIKASTDIELPDNFTGTQEQKYHYFRDHFFDNVDIQDDRLVNTPIFHSKIDYYYSKVVMQIPDTILTHVYKYVDRLDPKSEMFKYWVNHVMSIYEKSNIMGMDKVVIKMGEKYYCTKGKDGKSLVTWLDQKKLDEFCERVNVQKNILIGCKAPNIILRDTTDVKFHDLYSVKSDYTILYFWESNCGHCKTTTPKLERLYSEKLKARNVEVFAVSRGIDGEFKKWKDFIKTNKLSFMNVALTDRLYKDASKNPHQFIPSLTTLESLNYQTTYDVFSTPRVFILDKDKKIVAKNLSIAQIENFLDRLQDVKDAKVLFPLEEDTEEVNHQ